MFEKKNDNHQRFDPKCVPPHLVVRYKITYFIYIEMKHPMSRGYFFIKKHLSNDSANNKNISNI